MKKLEQINEHFNQLIEAYQKTNEAHRASSFRNALEQLENNFGSTDLPDNINSLKNLKGIGESTINEIKEVLQTGTSDRLEKLKIKLNSTEIDSAQSEDVLKSVLGGLLNK